MLRPWRDQFRIALGPTRVALIHLHKGVRPKAVDKEVIPAHALDNSGDSWEAACHALDEMLAKRRDITADVSIILSNRWVRYLLLPMRSDLNDEGETRAYLRERFLHIYGNRAEHWELRWSIEAPGQPSVACAIEAALLARLDEMVQGSSMAIRSVQPYLMRAYNQWRSRLSTSGWFVLAEPGHVCLSAFHKGRWAHLRSLSTEADALQGLDTLLKREALTNPTIAIPKTGQIYAPDIEDPTMGVRNDWSLEVLRPRFIAGLSPAEDRPLLMAT